MFKSWKTSLVGVVAIATSALVLMGVFTPEDATTANEQVATMVEHIGGIVLAIGGLIGLFARDNGVTSEDAGAK